MKKTILLFFTALLLAAMTGCGDAKTLQIGISQAADTILNNSGAFTDTLTKCDSAKAETLYGMDTSLLAEFEVYIGTGATAEELAIFRVNDGVDTEQVVAWCEQRMLDQSAACENYLPDEIPKISDSVMIEAGNYVFFCISNDRQAVVDVINNDILN